MIVLSMGPSVPTQPVQPIIPATPPMESVPHIPPPLPVKRSNVLVIIGIALLIVALGGAASYFAIKYYQLKNQITVTPPTVASPEPTATDDPTANWQIYTNTQYNYQINYPATAALDTSLTPKEIWISFDNQRVELKIGDNTNKLTAESIKTKKVSTLKIANFTTYTDTSGNDNGDEYINYYFSNNNIVYWVSVILPAGNTDQTIATQILSTFKFTDSTSAVPADWKTYLNLTYKYSIQYPSTWTTQNVAAGAGAMEALPNSEMVEIFEKNQPVDQKFEGILIQQVQAPTLPQETKVINNMTMYVYDNLEGSDYYVKIPNKDGYLEITGAGGNTASETKNQTIKQIFSTFKFTQ